MKDYMNRKQCCIRNNIFIVQNIVPDDEIILSTKQQLVGSNLRNNLTTSGSD